MQDLPWEQPLDAETAELVGAVADVGVSNGEQWERLWERLVHQYDVDDAAVKAVPLLVENAAKIASRQRLSHLNLIGSIALCARLPGSTWVVASAPASIRRAFEESLDRCAILIAESLRDHWNADETHGLLLAYSAVRGYAGIAQFLDRYETNMSCVFCGKSATDLDG